MLSLHRAAHPAPADAHREGRRDPAADGDTAHARGRHQTDAQRRAAARSTAAGRRAELRRPPVGDATAAVT